MSSITDNIQLYYGDAKEKLEEYYDNTFEFLYDNMLLVGIIFGIIVVVLLNLIFPNRVFQVLITNLNNIIILFILSLLIYILIFFLDKDKEYKTLRKFVEDRKVKLDGLIGDVNEKNTRIKNNDKELCNKMRNIGTSGSS
jgi:Na+/proline symporter